MTVYAALLRGVNVGGKNKLKMKDLREALERTGLHQVQTYIQSGNVLFESETDAELLQKSIEEKIKAVFVLEVPVILRTAGELEQLIYSCPFSEEAVTEAEAMSEGESLYVSMLQHQPPQEFIQQLSLYENEQEAYVVKGRDIYFLFRQSVRNSKLAGSLSKWNIPHTMRNWKTLNKLHAMAKAMENKNQT